jgi:hypothetical protein
VAVRRVAPTRRPRATRGPERDQWNGERQHRTHQRGAQLRRASDPSLDAGRGRLDPRRDSHGPRRVSAIRLDRNDGCAGRQLRHPEHHNPLPTPHAADVRAAAGATGLPCRGPRRCSTRATARSETPDASSGSMTAHGGAKPPPTTAAHRFWRTLEPAGFRPMPLLRRLAPRSAGSLLLDARHDCRGMPASSSALTHVGLRGGLPCACGVAVLSTPGRPSDAGL